MYFLQELGEPLSYIDDIDPGSGVDFPARAAGVMAQGDENREFQEAMTKGVLSSARGSDKIMDPIGAAGRGWP